MAKGMIFGTQDTLSHAVRQELLARDTTLVLYLSKKNQTMALLDRQRETIFQGELLDLGRIMRGMRGCEIVFLCGVPKPRVTWRIIEAMKLLDITRLVCVVKPIEKSALFNQISQTKTTQKKPRSSQFDLSLRMMEESTNYTILHLPDLLPAGSPNSDLQSSKADQERESELHAAKQLAQISEQPSYLAKQTLFISNHLV